MAFSLTDTVQLKANPIALTVSVLVCPQLEGEEEGGGGGKEQVRYSHTYHAGMIQCGRGMASSLSWMALAAAG